jgi:hypothetical protein
VVYKRGDLVNHPQFGEGVVYTVEKRSDDDLLTVYFQGYGAKKFLLSKATFTKVNN